MQQKLDVLGKVGLSKDNFSNADTKYMQVSVTRCHSLGDKCVSTSVHTICRQQVCQKSSLHIRRNNPDI